MAQNTDLNVSPYYDDYDETKNFHRILFRPSNAIQARELTQLQSILQNQIERFGNHIFDEGSLVMGGTTTVNTLYEAVKVNANNPNGSGTSTAETYRVASVGKYFQGQTSGVVGKVINSVPATTSGDPLTLYVTYVKSNADSSTTTYSKFLDNEELQEVTLNAAGTYADASNNNEFKTILPSEVAGHSSSTSTGSAATVRGGIFYTRGFFVRCDEQTILLDKYSNTPTYRIGLQVTESSLSSTDDTSLLDNASGSSNENAPGANRLKVELTFVAKAITGVQDVDNFIELSRVEEGTITKQVKVTAYSSIERTLARRTFDESGDYVVRPFQAELREHYNSKLNNGVYLSTNTSIPGDKTKLVTVVSSGKGYVKGFEVEKSTETFVTLDKARTKVDSGALAVPFNIGNFFNVNTVFGQPEFGTGSSAINAYGTISLRDTVKNHVEGGNGAEIGQARVRFFNCVTPVTASGLHTAASLFKIHLFDVRMYTELTVANTSHAYTAGQRIKGTVSGAKGTIAVTSAHAATTVFVMDIEGTFSTADTIRLEHETTGGKVISAVRNYSSDRVRQVYQSPRTANSAVFAANTITTDSQFVLTGTFTGNGSDATQTGVNTKFTQELKEGDVLVAPSGTTKIVLSVTNDTELELTGNGVAENGKYLRQRAQLQEQEKTTSVMPTPKNFVSELTPASVVIRKQATVTLSGAGGTVSGVSDESLVAEDANDYMVAIMEAEGDNTSGNPEDNDEGGVLDIAGHGGTPANFLQVNSTSGGAITFVSDNVTPLNATGDDQGILKVIYAANKDVADNNAAKTLKRSRGVKVTSTASAVSGSSASAEVYGTNINDEIITLGVPDVYSLRAVYESNDTTDALPPKLTVASGFGGNPGDRITGSSSDAVGKIIQVTGTTVYFYYVSEALFTTSDTVTNETSTNTSTNSRAVSAVLEDSKDITSNWLLDDGQRDGYYGLASIKRKAGRPVPTNKLLVIFDYFTASSGNFFTVNSYSDLEFENIPTYIPNVTDSSGLEPDGEIELSDAIDFRSYVHSLHDISGALDPTSAADISESSFPQPIAYGSEQFIGARAVTFDLPKSGQSLLTTKIEHFVPRIDKISLSSDGDFIVSKGEPSSEPTAPTTPSNSILLHTLYLPAYTARLNKISIQSHDHKRFTMRDIGRIQGRVKNLERVSSLNALEQETNLYRIQDGDGLDRFKSGFVTDNFRGHRTGDVNHPDYKIGVDRTTGTLRPQHNSKFVDLSLNTGASSGYKKTGDLITLPFTEEPYVTIGKASTTEFVNPYDVVLFNGTVTLSPSRDLWFDTQRLPSVRRTVEGDYDTVLSGVENALGTVWNNWQSDWLGEPVTTVEQPTNTTTTTTNTRMQRGGVAGGASRQNEMMDSGTRFEMR
jgi:hypothetical protein